MKNKDIKTQLVEAINEVIENLSCSLLDLDQEDIDILSTGVKEDRKEYVSLDLDDSPSVCVSAGEPVYITYDGNEPVLYYMTQYFEEWCLVEFITHIKNKYIEMYEFFED